MDGWMDGWHMSLCPFMHCERRKKIENFDSRFMYSLIPKSKPSSGKNFVLILLPLCVARRGNGVDCIGVNSGGWGVENCGIREERWSSNEKFGVPVRRSGGDGRGRVCDSRFILSTRSKREWCVGVP
jgi:hypothetical protein